MRTLPSAEQVAVQRKAVTAAQYLSGMVAANSADPEWDPRWNAALAKVAAAQEFLQNAPSPMDDATEADARRLMEVNKALAVLSSDKPNPYRLANDAIRWHAGIESDVSGSGFGSLDVSTPSFAGRPAFPTTTQANIPLRSGQHRRHILAWHSIREFVERSYAAHPEPVRTTIRSVFDNPRDVVSADAFAEAITHVLTGREKSGQQAGDLTADELLKVGLFVMNGNPRNLWAGKGSTNSALNTAQMHMNNALSGVKSFGQLGALGTKWSEAKGKAIYGTSTTVGAQMIQEEGNAAWERWLQQGQDPAKEAGEVEGVVNKIREYLISNLEQDVLGDTKTMTEIAIDKAAALRQAIDVIDAVATGKVDAGKVDPQFVSHAIREYLTYL